MTVSRGSNRTYHATRLLLCGVCLSAKLAVAQFPFEVGLGILAGPEASFTTRAVSGQSDKRTTAGLFPTGGLSMYVGSFPYEGLGVRGHLEVGLQRWKLAEGNARFANVNYLAYGRGGLQVMHTSATWHTVGIGVDFTQAEGNYYSSTTDLLYVAKRSYAGVSVFLERHFYNLTLHVEANAALSRPRYEVSLPEKTSIREYRTNVKFALLVPLNRETWLRRSERRVTIFSPRT